MRLIHYILLFSSISSGGTPINYAISFGAGYDDNVMRFSNNYTNGKKELGDQAKIFVF